MAGVETLTVAARPGAPVPIDEDVPLSTLTTFEIGGPARYVARCGSSSELVEALAWGRERQLATFVLGGGSNLLVADYGFDGLVLRPLDDSIAFEKVTFAPLRGDEDSQVRVRAGAGVAWDALVERAVAEGLGGLECLSGIPGLVGAAPIQNVGAYGQEVAETIQAVQVVSRMTGEVEWLPAESCGFGYRMSHFKGRWHDRYVVTAVDFLLPRRSSGTVRYPDLKRRLDVRPDGPAPSLAEVREAVLEVRRSKSMVLTPEDPNRRSAGSFFLNPQIPLEQAEALRPRCQRELPMYPTADDGMVKLPAAFLIEEAGFERGYSLGQAAISSRHTLALVNLGGAPAANLIVLAAKIRRGVKFRFGITLMPEPTFLGFDRDADTILEEFG